MATSIVQNSRLRFAEFLSVDGVEFFDVLNLPTIPVLPDDIVHVVSEGERLDLIAVKYYGDPVLWWVIAIVNDIEIPPFGVEPAARLRIPSPTFVTQRLFRKAVLR